MLATEASPVEVCLAFEALGRYAVPGPWVESAAYLPVALGREVEGIATVAVPPHVPLCAGRGHRRRGVRRQLARHRLGPLRSSIDRTRRLFEVAWRPGALGRPPSTLAVLAVSAQLLGAGERVLTDCVAYVKQRKQFGREIGSYQAIKHALADVRIALDFARPLVYAAALGEISPSAAKVAHRRRGVPRRPDRAPGARRDRLHRRARPQLWLTKIRALVARVGYSGRCTARRLSRSSV